MQPIHRCLAAALAFLVTFMAGRSSGIDPQAAAEAENAYQAAQSKKAETSRRINPTQLALLKAADAQYGLMAEALAVFSDDGTKPLFDRSIDPGIKDGKKGLANYRRLIVAMDRVAAAEPGFRQALKQLSTETGIERPGQPHSCQLLPGGPMQLFALWPSTQVCLMQTDSVLAGLDFWNIPARRRAADRETIRQVTLVDSGKLSPQKRKRLVERVYKQAEEVVKVNVNDEADKTRLSSMMTSQKEFYANLLDGKLDELAPHLHVQMCGDAEGAGEDYLKLADDRGETPGKILVRTGADAINSGVNVYVSVTKDALGTQLGEQVGTGIDAAKTTWEKIEQAEKGLPELKKNVAKDAKEVIRKRAIEFLSEKLGVPADALDKPTQEVGESVQDFGQNVEFDRRVAEAGKAGFQDLIEYDLKEGVKSFEVIRQATDKVSEQIQAEGAGQGIVQVGSQEDGQPLDGAVVWYEDPHTQSTKLLIHPLPVVPGEKLLLPDGAKVELVEMSDSGEIRRVTDGPILVSDDGVAMIGIQKSEQTPPPDAVVEDVANRTPPEPVEEKTIQKPDPENPGKKQGNEEVQGQTWLYQGVWLPEKYFPSGFHHYSSDTIPQGDPAQGHGSQSIWYGIPLLGKGGRTSSSAGEHPYTVFIDGMAVHKSVEIAKQSIQQVRESLKAKTSVALGDEAYVGDSCKGDDGSVFQELKGRDGIFCRNLNVWLVRVGRVTFGLRVSGDRVMDYNPNATGNRHFVAHPTPSRDDIMKLAQTFVERIRQYSKDKGWL
jgi:hypothetical protein